MHLSADQLVDIAEGTRDAGSLPHLRTCEMCRRQIDDLRAVIDTAAAAADVPEPSPLFWDHFSNRVVAAVEEMPRSDAWWRNRWAAAVLSVAGAAAAIFIATHTMEQPARAIPHPPRMASAGTVGEPLGEIDDDSLALVAELTATFDVEDAHAAGLAPRGAAEHAVTHLNDNELRELRHLLEDQMVSP